MFGGKIGRSPDSPPPWRCHLLPSSSPKSFIKNIFMIKINLKSVIKNMFIIKINLKSVIKYIFTIKINLKPFIKYIFIIKIDLFYIHWPSLSPFASCLALLQIFVYCILYLFTFVQKFFFLRTPYSILTPARRSIPITIHPTYVVKHHSAMFV